MLHFVVTSLYRDTESFSSLWNCIVFIQFVSMVTFSTSFPVLFYFLIEVYWIYNVGDRGSWSITSLVKFKVNDKVRGSHFLKLDTQNL